MSDADFYDALIIGGGPGGSTTATFLARAGRRVLLLEREHFPRFHIGESLLPYNRPIFEEMGLVPALETAGFMPKTGAQFHLGNGSKSLFLVFRQGRFTRHPLAIQVERSKFDHLLLQHARASGAEAREGWTVTAVSVNDDVAEVEACDPEGQRHKFKGSFVVDASGRTNLTGTQEGLRTIHPHLKKVAVFGHFSGVQLDEGEKRGDTVIVRLENKWFWLIPLSEKKVSVGCVMDREEFARSGGSPQQIFDELVQSSPPLRERMRVAEVLRPLQTTSDFSYYNRRLVGPRLIRVGDATGFMDPIFSAGVFLAMHSGRFAAKLVSEALATGDDGRRSLVAYEKRMLRSMQLYWHMVEGFYTKPFLEVFMEPRHRLDLPAAVTAILAGELEGGWHLWWRLRLFFLIIRLQAHWPLLPHISFDPLAAAPPAHKPA
jgi:FADH2-dependent halogenase